MSPAIQVSEKINCCDPAEYKEPSLSPDVPKGLGTCEVGRDDLWKYRSVVFVLGKGQQYATGTFPIPPKSEELSVKGHCKIVTKGRSCLGKGQSKQAGLFAVSILLESQLLGKDVGLQQKKSLWDVYHRMGTS